MTVHRPKQDRLILRLRFNDSVPEARLPRNPSVREFPVSWKNVIAPLRVVGVRQFLFLKLIRRRDGLHDPQHQRNQDYEKSINLHHGKAYPHRGGRQWGCLRWGGQVWISATLDM